MNRRIELHEKLVSVLGTRNVYYQPPESIRLRYPCIIYNKNKMSVKHADDARYAASTEYTVTVVDKNPDSTIADEVMRSFINCSFVRRYTADNLYHDVLTLFY